MSKKRKPKNKKPKNQKSKNQKAQYEQLKYEKLKEEQPEEETAKEEQPEEEQAKEEQPKDKKSKNRPWLDLHKKDLFLLKYAFSFLLTLAAFSNVPSKKYLLCCLLELGIIVLISDFMIKKKIVGQVINDILVLLYNIQMLVLFFGSSFVTLVMVTNIDSLEDLSGNFKVYIPCVILLLIFSFLPIRSIKNHVVTNRSMLSVFLALELVFVMYFGNSYSPLYGYFELANQEYTVVQQRKQRINGKDYTKEFHQNSILDVYPKPDVLAEKPNVIFIMTEGLSQNVITDSRNIMPNVAKYQEQSLWFDNYYNHTFATYRGIIGQLYSGYQYENVDENTLISAQSIFSDLGYQTAFVNTEPNNAQFTTYLENLGFDRVIGEPGDRYHGGANSLSDKEGYEVLFDTVTEQHDNGKPFFTMIYTFGTHASLDSPDEKFGDGESAMLNKFYNADYQFGAFMDRFVNSPLYEDTVIVFSADHATYAEKEYMDTFPDYHRDNTGLDQIPLFIFHKDVTATKVDAKGRNSLDAIPTIFDYLDMSAPNYFLGTTLFISKENANNYDTIYQSGTQTFSSEYGVIEPLSESQQKIFDNGVEKYYTLKLQGERK